MLAGIRSDLTASFQGGNALLSTDLKEYGWQIGRYSQGITKILGYLSSTSSALNVPIDRNRMKQVWLFPGQVDSF
jgi:hypothetical protein